MNDVAIVYAQASDVIAYSRGLLEKYGIPSDDANLTAHCLVRADLRGIDSHGIVRLPGYLDRIDRGLVNTRPNLRPEKVAATTMRLDGDNGLGFVVATRAMKRAIDMAHSAGIGVVGVHRSTHFGIAANYVLQAVAADCLALVFTNASRAMPPWGGSTALLGTSPVAAGAPTQGPPFVLDMSTAVAARGKIRRALRHGEDIPAGYALDAAGRPTTDPAAALDGGVVLPVGGPKGSGLAMLMDVLAGVLTGAASAGDVGDQYRDFDRPQDVGHLFMALRKDLFLSAAEFEARMTTLLGRVKDCPPAAGFDEVLTPGELEQRTEEQRRRSGIPYRADDLRPLADIAERVGVPPLRQRH